METKIPVFLIFDIVVQNKKSGISSLYDMVIITLSSLNLPLSSSSTTSRELLSQFATCDG